MPSDSLSEHDRQRLALLMKAPLIPPPEPPKKQNQQWPKDAWNAVAGRIRGRWDTWSALRVKNHIVRRRWEWAIGGAVGLGCLILLADALRVAVRPEDGAVETVKLEDGTVKLQIRERQGELQIRWDADSDPIRRATAAKLFIIDGAERIFVTLDGHLLRRGMVSYARRSERVELRMALTEPDGRLVEQQATFSAKPSLYPSESQLAASSQRLVPAAGPPSVDGPRRPQKAADVIEHRARKKPLVHSGTDLPFTCAVGDIFRKTDAPSGSDTFTCRGKNVWSLSPSQSNSGGSAQRPSTNATTLTAKPASASTT